MKLKAAIAIAGEVVWLLAGAYVLWRQVDPEGSPLGDVLRGAAERAGERARYREAIRRTLDSIRNLPESEA